MSRKGDSEIFMIILFLFLGFLLSMSVSGCASNPMHKDVEVGNEAVPMMQCRVLCDADKVYSFTNAGLLCQCQRPVREPAETSPIIRFEVINKTGQNDSEAARGVMTRLRDGKTIISSVPGGE